VNTERSGFVPGRFRLVGVVALALVGGMGCDHVRAWLAVALGERQGPSSNVAAGFGAYDCPPGVVRCVEGRVERSRGGTIDALTLERSGCPFEELDRCEGRCVDDEDHLEDELPELCLGDASYGVRHPRAESTPEAGSPEGSEGVEGGATLRGE
jgi:hypothetical protein